MVFIRGEKGIGAAHGVCKPVNSPCLTFADSFRAI